MPSITCLVVFPAHPQPQINTTFHLLCVNPRLAQLLRWEPLKSHGPQLLLGPGNLVSLICSPSLHGRFAKSSFPQPSYMFRSLPSSLHFLLHLKYKPPNSNILSFLPQTTCKLISIPNWPILALSPLSQWKRCPFSCWLILPLVLCAPFPTQENLDISVSPLPPVSSLSLSLLTQPLNMFKSLVS